MNVLFSIFELLANGGAVINDRDLHLKALDLENVQHKVEKDTSQWQHKEGLFTDKKNYLITMFADIESYIQELNANLLSSTLDAERDMVDQRNQQFQTILIAGTIMLGATIGVLFQAPLPQTSDDYIVGVYATSIAASIMLLFISVGLCVKVISLVSRYMYRYSERNMNYVRRASKEALIVMRSILYGLDVDKNGKCNSNQYAKSRKFSTMDNNTLHSTWMEHEKNVKKYLDMRNELNDNFLNDSGDVDEKSGDFKRFNRFWEKHCKTSGRFAYVCFYAGTICMLVSVITFMYAVFDKQFENLIAGYISIAVIGASLVACCAIVIFMKFIDPVTKELNKEKVVTLHSFPRGVSQHKSQ